MTARKRLRAALIGTGGIADVHLTAFQACKTDIELVAAVDIDEDRARAFAQKAGVEPYTEVSRMLAEQRPDLVAICTPPSLHVGQTVEVLESGAWAWCEKPPCLSLAGYDAITAAETEGGPYASFVFQHRFGSGAEHFRELLAKGELGRPLVAHCQTTWYRDTGYYAVPWRGKWETEGGGPAMGHGIHQMDLLLDLLGEWTEVSAMTARLVHDVETEDVSTALVRFANGALATVVNSVLSPQEVSRIRVDCTEATVELTHLYGYRNADWVYSKDFPQPEVDVPSSHTAQLPHVIEAIRAGKRPPASGSDGRKALELIAALYKSASTGAIVRAGEITARDPFHHSMNGRIREGVPS
ncbi:Gfo/Idh/MocA family protein [Amycolatopsis sp. cg5]|uniref:Gfo/Idh/MocA family protein n=1 Tax=Amycolatopsis sp. cg5 TaxID=3238802 RepID=UPI003524DE18